MWDIADYYNSTDVQDLLVRSVPLGAALAASFSDGNTTELVPDHSTVLMSKHGFTTCANSIELAVMQAIYTQVDANVQSAALSLRHAYLGSDGNGLSYLTAQQARDSWATNAGTDDRPWDLWVHQVESSNLYVNVLDPNQTAPAAPDYVS